MKKKLAVSLGFILLYLSSVMTLQAQQEGEKKSVIHLSVWDPVGTNGKLFKEYTNVFSFNLLYGRSKSEQVFTFSGLATVVEKDASGVQIAGLTNIVGGNTSGLTFSGLVNITSNSRGVVISGLSNISQDVTGLQFTGLSNISQNVRGIQVAGLINISQNVSGFQFSGLSNIAQDVSGIQISGLGNVAQNMKGLQFAGLGNVAEELSGFQVAGLGNVAQNVRGVQFAGLYNNAKNVSGVQISGILNKADHSDYPIGLVNLIKDGEMSVGLTFDELQNLTAAFRSGGRVLYGILGVGYNFKSSESLMTLEAGLGAHINFTEKFRMNTELVNTTMTQFKDVANRASLRILPAYKFAQGFELFAGPTLNYLQSNDTKIFDLYPKHSLWDKLHSSGDKDQLYIGYLAGVQYIF